MQETKVRLSANELLLMQNSEWILTKNSVVEKVANGLGNLANRMQAAASQRSGMLMVEIVQSSAKVSRGEKYLGLPYLILDYPRVFEKENILAIRTLFWWGNYYSITLHVKGKYHAKICQTLTRRPEMFMEDNYYISFSGNEWTHDVNGSDYRSLTSLNKSLLVSLLPQTGFLKITAKIGIGQWEDTEEALFGRFLDLVKLLED